MNNNRRFFELNYDLRRLQKHLWTKWRCFGITYGKPAGLPSEIFKKAQAPTPDIANNKTLLDSCTIPTPQRPSSRPVSQQSAVNLQSPVTKYVEKEHRLVNDCRLQTKPQSRDKDKSTVKFPVNREFRSRGEVKYQKKPLSGAECSSQAECSDQAKCVTEEKRLSMDKVGKDSPTTGTLLLQDTLVRIQGRSMGDTIAPSRPARPSLDLRTMIEERLQVAQLKRSLKAEKEEEEGRTQSCKRIKLEASA